VYRFEPLDTSGVFLGLSTIQCALLGSSLLAGVLLLNAGAPLPVAAASPLTATGLCFARIRGHAAWEWLPLAVTWIRTRQRGTTWLAPIPLVDGRSAGALPPCLEGLVIRSLPWRGSLHLGVVHDTTRHTLTTLIPASGPQFVIEPRVEQERLLAGWADVLNQFAVEGGAVTHVAWSDFATRSGLEEHRAWLHGRRPTDAPAQAVRSYEALLAQATASSTTHEVVLSITVALDRVNRRRDGNADDRLVRALVSAVDALLRGLRSAGLTAADPLGAGDIRRLARTRIDPGVGRARVIEGRLVDRLGIIGPQSDGPIAVDIAWDRVRIDGCWHRTWWIATWPRLAVPPAWLEPFLSGGGMTRAVTVVLRPVPPHQSRRRIERDLVKLESDAATKEDKGRRVDARHRRATQALLSREEEIVAGHAEMAYAGFVTVSAPDEAQLDEDGERLEQLAREAGMELRCLVGRQDTAWAAALPFGLAPSSVLG
jgi:hypothetical protein